MSGKWGRQAWLWLDDLGRDVRLAARALRRTPAFTTIAVASLVLGLTLAAVTLAVTNAYLVRSLPYPAADRLYHVLYAPPGPFEPGGLSAMDWSSVADVVEHPITAAGETLYLSDGGYAQPSRAFRVNRGFLDALGVRAVLGRTFTNEELSPSSDPVAMLGYALWRDRFGGDSAIIGRQFRADVGEQGGESRTFRVVGVLPPGFWFGRESSALVDVLLPLQAPARTYLVRLRDGVTVSLAERRLTEAARAVATSVPSDWTGVHLESAHERYVGALRPVLLGTTVAALLVLAIACVNVSVLVLLRALQRQKEMSVRIALGAGRRHIVRLLVAESGLLCVVSVGLVVLITRLAFRFLSPLIEAQLGRPAPRGPSAIGIDSTVLLVVAGTGMLIALSLSLIPLATPWHRRLAETLRSAGRHGTDGTSMRRVRSVLIGFELAGSLVLLVGCGLMVRSLLEMAQTDLGVRIDGVVRARVVVPSHAYPDQASLYAFYERVTERAATLARGRVALTSWPPFFESMAMPLVADGTPDTAPRAGVITVGPDYFSVVGTGIREGRSFTPVDRLGSEPVAIVSQTLARRLWPNTSALGHRIRAVEGSGSSEPAARWRTVVGVAQDVRQTYADPELGDVYLPFYQIPPERFGTFYLRTDVRPPVVESRLRSALGESDPLAIVRGVADVGSENRQLAGTRFLTLALSAFAAFAAILAVVGMYGVIAYAVLQRRREFAIRIALGATRQAVTRLSMRAGSVVLACGLACGVLAAAAAGRVLQSRLYGVPPFDVWTVVAASVLMGAAGVLAIWWPARRAAAVDPVTVLGDT
jgi:putative ABC transport system permease protein